MQSSFPTKRGHQKGFRIESLTNANNNKRTGPAECVCGDANDGYFILEEIITCIQKGNLIIVRYSK